MKAIGDRARRPISLAPDGYAAVADRLLLDAKPPKGATRPGGNGAPFDWSLLAGFDPGHSLPALRRPRAGQRRRGARASPARPASTSPPASRRAPGRKDPDLIRAFIANARGAGAAARTGRAS